MKVGYEYIMEDVADGTLTYTISIDKPSTEDLVVHYETRDEGAIAGEDYEHTNMYPTFADIADEEGLPEIAQRLRAIANAEANHQERYEKVLEELKNETIFKNKEEVEWVCRECGYVHKGKTPPEICPSCDHPKAYYELKK